MVPSKLCSRELPICKAIIEERGGEMGIESEEGKGTTVWFTLLVKDERT